jgi:hypothetical protein
MTTDSTITPELLDRLLANYEKRLTAFLALGPD